MNITELKKKSISPLSHDNQLSYGKSTPEEPISGSRSHTEMASDTHVTLLIQLKVHTYHLENWETDKFTYTYIHNRE